MENKPPYKKVFTFLGGTIGFLLLCSLIYFIADPDLLSLFILFGIGAFAGFVMTCLFILSLGKSRAINIIGNYWHCAS